MSRNSLLWTASKIALFLLLALAVRPLEAVTYHIGTTGTNTTTDIYYANLQAMHNALTGTGMKAIRDSSLIFYQESDNSMTYNGGQAAFEIFGTVDMRASDALAAAGKKVTISGSDVAGRLFDIGYSGTGASTATLNISSDFIIRDINSSYSGTMAVYWGGTLNAEGVTYLDNFSAMYGGGIDTYGGAKLVNVRGAHFEGNTGYRGGGVEVFMMDEADFTNAKFINNNATDVPGGAIIILLAGGTRKTTVTLGATDGQTSEFRGNSFYDYTTNTSIANSIYVDYDGAVDINIDTVGRDENGNLSTLDLIDPIYLTPGYNYTVNITKTGEGIWKIGGETQINTGSGNATITINEGTLEFYEDAKIFMTGVNDKFVTDPGAITLINGGNRIQGSTVKFNTDSILLFNMDYFFVSGNPTTNAMLFLQGTSLAVSGTTIDVLNLPEEARGSFTLIEGAEDLVAGDFNLLRDGVKIQGAASKRLGFTLNNSDDPKKLVLYVGDTENSVLVWNNEQGNGVWSLNYKNWDDQYVTHGTDAFIPNDTVIFDDSVGGGGTHTITLEGTVAVSKDNNFHTGERGMRVSGTKDWVFKGGSITDSYSETNMAASGRKYLAALVFDGSGTLTLNNDTANTYHDGTVISGGGTIVARGVNSLGSTKYIGKATDATGVVVQNSGYGIEFTDHGGAIRLQSGTTYESGLPVAGIWDQRIRVADDSSGTISINNKATEPLVVMVDEKYQTYARDKNGGAINVGNGGTLVLSGNFLVVENHSRGSGGAIFAGNNATVKIDNASFASNDAAGSGGAIYLGDGTLMSAVSNVFQSNKAELGGAIYHAGNSTGTSLTLTVSRSSFGSLTTVDDDPTGNAADSGGAIYIADGHDMVLSVSDSTFYGNNADLGGGGAVFGGDHLVMSVSNTLFQANEAATIGGAVQLGDAANFSAKNTRFLSNQAVDGGALSIGANAINVTVDEVIFTSNRADRHGGAVSLGDATGFVATSATFQNNKAVLGGAVYHAGNTAALPITLTFENSFFGQAPADISEVLTTGNTADSGGAIYIADGSNITLNAARSGFYGNQATVGSGGAIYAGGNSSTMANRFSLALDEMVFQGNTAMVDGGAIVATDFTAISANDVTFRGNKAQTGDGGAVRVGDESQLIDWNGVVAQSNEAEDGSGGALYLGSNSKLEFRDSMATASEFAENKAAQSGGAIYFESYGKIDATSVGFKNNKAIAGSGGAIAMEREAILNLDHATFQGNTADERGGAIDLGIESRLSIDENTIFSGNTAGESGGAVSMRDNATLNIVQKSTFTNNTATEFHGGAVFLGENSWFDARNGVAFTGNKAGGDGGAIYLSDVTSSINTGIIAWGATFTQNAADGSGGAIRVNGGSNTGMLTVDLHDASVAAKTVFDRNTAGVSGGAISGGDFVFLDADRSEFKNNTAAAFGGAVRLGSDAAINILSATFTSNRLTDITSEGGAIYAGNNATIQGNGATFTGNGATRSGNTPQAVGLYGGAIRVGEDSDLYLNDAMFKQNMVGAKTGKAGAATGMGGAIYAGADTLVNVKRSVFESNNASHSGGAVYLADNKSATSHLFDADGAAFRANVAQNGEGGALWIGAGNDLSMEADNNTAVQFTSNRAGGAGGAIYYAGGRTVTATDAVFTSNSAGGTGGAIHVQNATDLIIVGANFASNNAVGAGGAIYATSPGTLLANQARFAGNNGAQGGAIYFGQTGSTTTLQGLGSEFTGNAAKNGSGGALYAINANLNLYGSIFRNNTATGKGGAIYYETNGGTRSLSFGAGVEQITGFSGNMAGGASSSSIHFVGKGTSTTTINMSIDAAADGTFELLDSMRVDGTDNNVRLNISKTGLGTMVLGNVHDLRGAAGATTFTVQAGAFDMQKDAQLMLTHKDGGDSFSMAGGGKLISRGENVIAAEKITVADELHFDLNNVVPNSKAVALTLDGTVLSTIGGTGYTINIIDFVDQTGFYNLVRTGDVNNFANKADLADTAMQYKGVDFQNNDRIADFWELRVDEDTVAGTATLQLELRQWENTTMTWNGNSGNLWNVEQRNWLGTSEGKPVDQFLDGDSVVFTDQGAGVVNVSPNDVVVDSMVVDSSNDYEFQGGTITGNMFVKRGSGTLTMSSAYEFNSIDIVNGTLLGGVGSDWTVIGNLHLQAGTMFRPTDKFRVDGNFSMAGGSNALWELGAVQSHSTAITASGAVDFGTGGGDVRVRIENVGLSSGQYASDNPIVTATGGLMLDGNLIDTGVYGVSNRVVQIVDGEQSLVLQSDRSLALQAVVVSKDSTELSLIAFGTGFGADGPTTDDFNQNQMAVYEALENADYQTLANEFFVELAKLGSVEEKAEALDNMHTRVNSAAVLVAERNILKINTTIYDRARLLEELRSSTRSYRPLLGQSSYGGQANYSPWFTNLGDFMDQDGSGGTRGFKSKMYGFMLGVDRNLSRDTIFGIGLGGTFSTVESGISQSAKADSYMISVYGAYNADDWTLTGNLGAASTEYEFKRRIFTVDTETSLRGSSVFGGLEISKKFRNEYTDIRPYASLQFVSMNVDSFTDRSLGVAGNVKVKSSDSEAFLQTLGVRFGRARAGLWDAVWMPSLNMGWIHDYGKGNIRSTTSFGNTSTFTVVGAKRARDRIIMGVGSHVAYQHVTFHGSYDSEFSGRYVSHTVQVGLNFAF